MTNRKRTTKAGGATASRNRWKGLLATRQPDAVIEAFQRIAKKRNTTVSAMLGEAAVKIVADAREGLPQKLQGQLRNLSAERPPSAVRLPNARLQSPIVRGHIADRRSRRSRRLEPTQPPDREELCRSMLADAVRHTL
jgi:hypothetical protein